MSSRMAAVLGCIIAEEDELAKVGQPDTKGELRDV
jgi:hypothetical protein